MGPDLERFFFHPDPNAISHTQLANTEEFEDGVSTGTLGEVLIRYSGCDDLAVHDDPALLTICYLSLSVLQMQQRIVYTRCR